MSQSNLHHAIRQYLDTAKTDYAVMINGEWGSGKTYYLKKELFKELEKEKPELRCIYISLFGVTGSLDLNKKFFLEVYPFLNNKWAKTAGAVGKSVLSHLGFDFGKDQEDALIEFVSKFNDNTLIVFDDLERLDKDLLIEILGFINQIVEHNNIKVIISANEKEILEGIKKDSSDYERYIEKLVRHKLQFKLGFDEIGGEIIRGAGVDFKFQGNILEAFSKGENRNLRTLQFASSLSSNILKSLAKVQEVDQPVKDQIAGLAIYFLSTLSIEVKARSLKYVEMKKLASWSVEKPVDFSKIDFSNVDVVDVADTGDGVKRKTFKSKNPNVQQEYYDKYFSPNSIMYFDSVVECLDSGFWDEGKFIDEVKQVVNYLTTKAVSEPKMLLDQLFNYERLNDEDLNGIVDKVLDFVGKGEYQIDGYLRIYNVIASLINLKLYKYKVKQLYKDVCKGIEKCKDKNATHYIQDFVSIPDNADDFTKKIYEKTIERNQEVKTKSLAEMTALHFKEFFDNPNAYAQKHLTKQGESIPPFHFACTPKEFLKKYDALKNDMKNDLGSVFYQRQKGSVQIDKSEMSWMRGLKDQLEKDIKKDKVSIAIQNKKRFVHIVNKVIDTWASIEHQLEE
ncbi:MAG: hypothetical protein OJF59_000586 [Cytophagales bacterium]|jgi:hypothetical protein|nr:hypothetical protein [Bacteroidota bacterium]WHZ06833.1 MAG: hypothetical protein OJF59_000586 [Cytophagales bacterium]